MSNQPYKKCSRCNKYKEHIVTNWEWSYKRNSRNRVICKSCINDERLMNSTGKTRVQYDNERLEIKHKALLRKGVKNKSRVIELSDSYIASSLGFKTKDLPKAVIETKRNIIKIRRLIRDK